MNTESEIQNSANGADDPKSIQHQESSVEQPSTIPQFQHSNPAPPLRDSTTPVLSSRHRRGWIARLPKETRQRVNEMLDDGLTYNAICESLGEEGKHITERCLVSWRAGGYQDYLRHEEMLTKCRARQFNASSLLTNRNSVNAFQATQQVATAQICETVLDIGTDILRKALAENPLNYFRMLNAFSRLTNGGIRCERHLVDELERKAKTRRGPRGKKGVSSKSLKEMEDKLKLM